MKQVTIFDIIGETEPKPIAKDIPCGYIRDFRVIGRELEFQELKDFIGKKIVCAKVNESNQYFRVYRVIKYIENSDTYYKRVRPLPENQIQYGEIVNDYIHDIVGIKECMACYEPFVTCDRVALSDKDTGSEPNSWISEAYCANGRYELFAEYEEGYEFYELTFCLN